MKADMRRVRKITLSNRFALVREGSRQLLRQGKQGVWQGGKTKSSKPKASPPVCLHESIVRPSLMVPAASRRRPEVPAIASARFLRQDASIE